MEPTHYKAPSKQALIDALNITPEQTNTMQNTNNTKYGLSYWAALTIQTRRYGYTYVHSGARDAAEYPFRAFERDGIRFSYSGWGRSLASGGHKYKVHARYIETNRPVPSKVLKTL